MSEPAITRDRIHEALNCLYESVELCGAELASLFPEIETIPGLEARATRLRTLLLQALEVLRPVRRYPFGALESRSYDVLTLRYVENMPVQQIAEELSLSVRQVHRDLWRAEEKLAAVIESQIQPRTANTDDEAGPFRDELEVLRSQPMPVDLAAVARAAMKLVEPLASALGVAVRLEGAAELPIVADQAVLKQVVTQLLSLAIQTSRGDVTVRFRQEGDQARVSLSLPLSPGTDLDDQMESVRAIARSQGYGLTLSVSGEGQAEVALELPGGRPRSVLVVEDNPGAVALYRRYLAGGNWQVHAASDPRFACSMAAELAPDVIVLDIMMPKMDGWSVLESLGRQEATAGIPVLICSIIQDERLAKALGADYQLQKPVSRGQFLAALNHCLQRV